MSFSDRRSVTFAASGEYFVSGGTKGVQVWRVEDGQLVATMQADQVRCVAFSKDGKWIAAGTFWGDVMVWDAKIHKQTFTTWKIEDVIRGLDFSPDGTRLLALGDRTATIWNLTTRERVVRPLHRDNRVWAAKYSLLGHHIATATQQSVRIYDSNDVSRPPQDIPVQATVLQFNTGLVWCRDHIFVLSDRRIKKIDASTCSVVAEWLVPASDNFSCLVMPKHGKFIACSANRTVTFWDTSTHTQLGLFHHSQDIYSIALSPDGRFLAIGVDGEKIFIKRLSCITPPDIEIDNATINLWKCGQLTDAEQALTVAIHASPDSHHMLAGRALVRAHMEQPKEAIVDANESIQSQPSVIGYIAKSMALVGNGETNKAYRACDIAFQYSHSTHISFLLLIKAIVVCMAGEHDDAISRVEDLIPTLHMNTECYIVQAYMYLLLGKSLMESGNYDGAVRSFVYARTQLQNHTSRALSVISLISGWKFDNLDITIRRHHCEALYTAGHIQEAGESLLGIVNTLGKDLYAREPIATWIFDFLQQFLSTPGSGGNAISEALRDDYAPTFHATHNFKYATLLLTEWAKLKLNTSSWRDTLSATVNFRGPRFTIFRIICIQLYTLNKIVDATDCFHGMRHELGGETNLPDNQAEWVRGFKQDLSQKLENLGDVALHAQRYDEAVSEYSAALSLVPLSPQGLLMKRSEAYVAQAKEEEAREKARSALGFLDASSLRHVRSLWEKGLQDANEIIALDPSSPWGYERKHAALHRAGLYDDAINAFETMLLKMAQSPDSNIYERQQDYVNPAQTKAAIRRVVQDTIRNSPRVLIHTTSGRLFDKHGQALLFESLPVYQELISSMTTHIDEAYIQREAAHYYRYATFSHTWEDNEPVYDQIVNTVVYNLEESFTHNKLRTFCKIARDAGLHWAWSDTCCINKSDNFVLQEALVAMFKWYEGSAVTIVFLRGVHSPSRRGDLIRSMWNTRAWTFQEYHASKVVRFYTEEWAPYMNIDIQNHKDSPEIISEMEEATGVSAQALKDLRPGLHDIREKLCLASGRATTFVEDAAYSLLGIFTVSLPILYGEGDQALGRLLAHLLTSSGDTSILAWTGKSGSFNSCLPASISVFSQLPTPHIPSATTCDQMETITTRLRTSQPNLSLVMKLYDQLHDLVVPSFAGQRMRLPCLTFKLGPVSGTQNTLEYVFRARTEALGVVEIRTTEDLSRLNSLILVHPWIDFLLDRHPVGNIMETTPENASRHSTNESPLLPDPFDATPVARPTRASRLISQFGRPFGALAGDSDSLLSPSSLSLAEKRAQALRFVVRLQKPFGALLFTPLRQNVGEYRRVASESLITVHVKALTTVVLNKLIEGARALEVL